MRKTPRPAGAGIAELTGAIRENLVPSREGCRVSGGVGTRRSSPQPGPRQPRQRLRNQPHRLLKVCAGRAKAEAETD